MLKMKEVAKAVFEIKNASGSIAKSALLRKYAGLPGFKDVMRFIYDPYVRTGIAEKKLVNGRHNVQVNEALGIGRMINYFMTHQTGSDADIYLAWCFINAQETELAKLTAVSLVTKDLQIGVTSTTLNTVYGKDFIPKIGIMLGMKYSENKDKVKGPHIVTEKLDGHRRVLVKEKGNITLYTRSGHIDSGLPEVEEEAAQYLPDNFAYDSEFLAKGVFKDSIALRQATSSIMNSKGIRRGVTMNVFDCVPVEEFKAGCSKDIAVVRKIVLGAMFRDESIRHLAKGDTEAYFNTCAVNHTFEHIKTVPILGVAFNEQDVLNFAEPIWARHFEGVMLNSFTGLYEIKRTKELLKVKDVIEMTLPIVDFIPGEGKYTGMLGSFLVGYKGQTVGVGSGLTDDQRASYWVNRQSLVGKMLELDTFGESTDKSGKLSLNCAIFKRLVGEE